MTQRRSKGANEVIPYEFEFLSALETVWHPKEIKSATQYVRPTVGNGYEYECTDGGLTGTEEPDWPETIGGTVDDGTVEWTCRDFGSNATDSISTHQATADSGITVDSSSVLGTVVTVTLSGGTLGMTYDVRCRIVTTAGQTYEELLRVTITH
jgi:hypothetical protein